MLDRLSTRLQHYLRGPPSLAAVVGLSDADLEAICASVRAATPGAVCQLANFLFPQGRVVSGVYWLGAPAGVSAGVPAGVLAGVGCCCAAHAMPHGWGRTV